MRQGLANMACRGLGQGGGLGFERRIAVPCWERVVAHAISTVIQDYTGVSFSFHIIASRVKVKESAFRFFSFKVADAKIRLGCRVGKAPPDATE